MSEPTNAQMAEQEDMRLDAQIAELMEARAEVWPYLPTEWMTVQNPPPILVEVEECNP